jgi:hypothetical protein
MKLKKMNCWFKLVTNFMIVIIWFKLCKNHGFNFGFGLKIFFIFVIFVLRLVG